MPVVVPVASWPTMNKPVNFDVPDECLVTVVVPVRNEAATISGCIESIACQDIGADRLQVVVVDGGSADDTLAAARAACGAYPFGQSLVVRNDVCGNRPSNLNRGLREATGTVLCRVDARTRLPTDYVRRCLEALSTRPEVCVFGGRQRAVCADGGRKGAGVARAMNNRWSMGGAYYRRSGIPGPADTVYLGAFRTGELREVGGWDERMEINEDFDLNRRFAKRGSIWFDPSVECEYTADPSLGRLAQKFFRYGRGKVVYWRRSGSLPQPRQLAIACGVPVMIFGAGRALAAPRWRRPVALGALVGAVAVEYGGSLTPSGDLVAHTIALVATGIIGGSWVSGVWVGLATWASSAVSGWATR